MKALAITLVTGFLLCSTAPMRASEPESSERQFREHQLTLLQERCETLSQLLRDGYAAPVELQIAQSQLAALQRREQVQQQQSVDSPLNLATDQNPKRLLVRLPGFSSYLRAQSFAEVCLDYAGEQAVANDQTKQERQPLVVASQTAQARAVHAELEMKREYRRRVGAIADGSRASDNELQHLSDEIHLLELVEKVAATDQEIAVLETGSSADANTSTGSPLQDLPAAIAEIEAHAQRLQVEQEHSEQLRQTHANRVRFLSELPPDEITRREIEHESLHSKMYAAKVDKLADDLSRVAWQLRYLRSLESPAHGDFDRESTVECIRQLIAAETARDGEMAWVNSRIELAQFQADAISTLYAEGVSTWLEHQLADLKLKKAEAAAQLAIQRRELGMKLASLLPSGTND